MNLNICRASQFEADFLSKFIFLYGRIKAWTRYRRDENFNPYPTRVAFVVVFII